uniref:DNA polymerase n=1 Tax=Panagrellus redivivus TaxID=6233 RepID=A0A7E4VXQ1_PANRE
MSDEEGPSRRSLRARGPKKTKAAEDLEKLRNLRAHGRVHREDVTNVDEDLYDEVDEEEYEAKYSARNFVEDDDGAGYGTDDDDQDDYNKAKKDKEKKKKEREESRLKRSKIDSFFSTATKKTANFSRKVEAAPAVDEELHNVLEELAGAAGDDAPAEEAYDDFGVEDEVAEVTSSPSRNIFKRPASPTPLAPRAVKLQKIVKKSVPTFSKPAPVAPIVKAEPIPAPDVGNDYDEDMDFNAPMDFDPVPSESEPKPVVAEAKPKAEVESPVAPVKSTPGFAQFSTKNNLSLINTDNFLNEAADETPKLEPSKHVSLKDEADCDYFVTTEDGKRALRMYWFDAYEEPKVAGRVYLFGFIKTGPSAYKTVCLVVKNIQQKLFFVKRDTVRDSDEAVTVAMVYDEVCELLQRKYNVKQFKARETRKKFAAMDEELIDEADCLEVLYGPNFATVPGGPANGRTYRRVLNATVTPLERLLTEQDIRGPCWIDVTDAQEVAAGSQASHCQHEFIVNIKMLAITEINVAKGLESEPVPTARAMAINVLTMANKKTNKPQIVLISMLQAEQYSLSQPNSYKWNNKLTLIAPPTGCALPVQFQQDAANRRITVEKFANEKQMLAKFLRVLKDCDPDLLIGHDIAAQLALLRERLEEHGIQIWHFLGRLKRKETLKQLPANKAFRWALTAGRLCIDSKSAAMELVKSQSYDLDELVSKVLAPVDPKAVRINVDSEQIQAVFFENKGKTDSLFQLICWSFQEAEFSQRILAQLSALPLFLQITQIVGGVLSRTLMGGRAERNEYLLLHAFYKDGFVAPDKLGFKPKHTPAVKAEPTEDGGDGTAAAPASGNSKKAQYTGGLVLEPKKGLYETYIVLLDFNSLYPSIIQEFNICFTTVSTSESAQVNETNLPNMPDASTPQGILPREICKLVMSRREVKNEMKRCPDKNSERYKQYDIRQLGLKLTANSMYGCLGFDGSRFCAKTLAAMITAKGREILEATRNIVENNGYAVIYGDTDSIMVNTNSTDLAEAKRIGTTIKKLINKSYKCLTLDIDGVYKRLLLLKKKKYAGLAIDLSNETRVSRELKGLDIVRRDWSTLAREVGEVVVNAILSSPSHDEMIEAIRKTLSDVKEAISNGSLAIEKFEILKKLTHRPEDYNDSKAQPHVQVALRLNKTRNRNLRQSDVVKYVICEDGTNNPATQRAYAAVEIEGDEKLKIDAHYYLSHQIHPVVSRLCEPIEEMDACQVAMALGLDPTGYRRKLRDAVDAEENDENAGIGLLDFEVCDPLTITCPKCNTPGEFREAAGIDGWPVLARCPGKNASCDFDAGKNPLPIERQITEAMNAAYKKFLESQFICDDCNATFDFAPPYRNVFGHPCPACNGGFLKRSYTKKRLYDQQMFYAKILNFQEWREHEAPMELKNQFMSNPQSGEVLRFYEAWLKHVQRIGDENAYAKVDLSVVFAPMRIA